MTVQDGPDPRRAVPRTDAVLAELRTDPTLAALGPALLKAAVTEAQDQARAGHIAPTDVTRHATAALTERLAHPSTMRPVLNATGVILHTNIGRAPLTDAAVSAIGQAAAYVDVELDLADGTRARRGRGLLTALAERVPAAGAGLVVNNGAAALVLATTALAAGRDVLVSRGEMVEIGDGFRLPDLIRSTGARLHEVGTTNRTTVADYASAIGPDTAAILKVHPSNFRIEGFTGAASVADLAPVARDAGLPLVVDIGSGLLTPHPRLPDEPDATTTLRDGATLVTASGDKLLGGPQAGLLLGDADVIERLRRHPLARALRLDKLTAAALEATLRGGPTRVDDALMLDPDALHARTLALATALREGTTPVPCEVVPSAGAVGGGSAPGVTLPGWALQIPMTYAAHLRRGDPAVLARVESGTCLLDLRCIPPADDPRVLAAIRAIAAQE